MVKNRCFGNGVGKEFYAHYHDHEWGIAVHDDQLLFEMLTLEGAQAGLSWETILKRRKAYQEAFYNFDVVKVAGMSDHQLEKLIQDSYIIKNRLKIYSVRQNAQVFLQIQQEFGSFDHYLWSFVHHVPIITPHKTLQDIVVRSQESDALLKDLKKRGMKFVGTTIMYAFMQAIGMVNGHVVDCWRYGLL